MPNHFTCGTCTQPTDIGLAWHCSYCREHHVPIYRAHCDICGAARTPKLPSDPGINDRFSPETAPCRCDSCIRERIAELAS